MNYQWIENIKEFDEIAEAWDQALIKAGSYSPFLLSDFIIRWWKYFSENKHLRIFVLFKNGCIVGGLPLYLKRGNSIYGFIKNRNQLVTFI